MTLWKNLFIGAYLIIQLILPLRGCLQEKFETRGNFSWNMYANIYGCSTQYRLDTPDGETHWPAHEDYFHRENITVFHGDTLPEYHRWLCDKFRNEGKLGSLRGYMHCSVNGGPLWVLVDSRVDLCSALNYGVMAQPKPLKK